MANDSSCVDSLSLVVANRKPGVPEAEANEGKRWTDNLLDGDMDVSRGRLARSHNHCGDKITEQELEY